MISIKITSYVNFGFLSSYVTTFKIFKIMLCKRTKSTFFGYKSKRIKIIFLRDQIYYLRSVNRFRLLKESIQKKERKR